MVTAATHDRARTGVIAGRSAKNADVASAHREERAADRDEGRERQHRSEHARERGDDGQRDQEKIDRAR
jgi:hypothetical protein